MRYSNSYGLKASLCGLAKIGGFTSQGSADPLANHPITLMTAGTWYEYTGDTLSTLSPDPTVSLDSPLSPQDWSDVNGNTGFAGIFKYSGGVFFDNKLWVTGGGHNDYYGNEWYYFDVALMEWVRHNWPDLDAAANYLIPDGYADDTSRPSAYHTYTGLSYSTTSSKLLRCGGYPSGTDTGASAPSWTYNTNTDTYTELADQTGQYDPNGYVSDRSLCTCWDATNDRFWIVANGGLWSRSASSPNTATCRINWYYGSPSYDITTAEHNNVCHDRSKDILVCIGSSAPMVFDISSPNSPTVQSYNGTWTGNASSKARTNEIGLDYDVANGQVIAWSGGADIYIVDGDALTITTESPVGGNTVTPSNPGAGGGGGPFGRFRYIGQWGGKSCFIAVNSVSGSVFIYKRA